MLDTDLIARLEQRAEELHGLQSVNIRESVQDQALIMDALAMLLTHVPWAS